MFSLSLKERLSKRILRASRDCTRKLVSDLNAAGTDVGEERMAEIMRDYYNAVSNTVIRRISVGWPEFSIKIQGLIMGCDKKLFDPEKGIDVGALYALCYQAMARRNLAQEDRQAIREQQKAIIDDAINNG